MPTQTESARRITQIEVHHGSVVRALHARVRVSPRTNARRGTSGLHPLRSTSRLTVIRADGEAGAIPRCQMEEMWPNRTRKLVLQSTRRSFIERDPTVVAEDFGPENYKQHNPVIADGPSAIAKMIPTLTGLTYEPGMAVADGDLRHGHGRYTGWNEADGRRRHLPRREWQGGGTLGCAARGSPRRQARRAATPCSRPVSELMFEGLQNLLARMDTSLSLRVVVFESANP